eukprot:TRINITY_DN16332_c0_g2_i1.p1 TRINITY_DN16332_c0_g2~~TRINITY_DN16332_c0_g2_i1.p1  ORF type:complete len:383 (-),score=44.64 TRINITY_DN16332_c0_g2_i1:85-1173(-)
MTPLLGKLTVQEANALIKTLLTYPASLKHGTGLSEEETLALARFAWVNGFDEDFQRDCLAKYQSDFTRPAMHWWELEDLKVACMTQEEFMTTEYKIATRSSSCAINIPVLRLSYRVAQLEKFKGQLERNPWYMSAWSLPGLGSRKLSRSAHLSYQVQQQDGGEKHIPNSGKYPQGIQLVTLEEFNKAILDKFTILENQISSSEQKINKSLKEHEDQLFLKFKNYQQVISHQFSQFQKDDNLTTTVSNELKITQKDINTLIQMFDDLQIELNIEQKYNQKMYNLFKIYLITSLCSIFGLFAFLIFEQKKISQQIQNLKIEIDNQIQNQQQFGADKKSVKKWFENFYNKIVQSLLSTFKIDKNQ